MDDTPAPLPGWYPDPNDPSTDRYWDGRQWTESRAPRSGGDGKAEKAEGVDIVGYVLAALMPLIGFIIGLVRLNKSRHGVWIVVVSLVAFFVWIAIFASAGSGGGGGAYGTY